MFRQWYFLSFCSPTNLSAVLENALVGLTHFKHAYHWKEYWMLKNINDDASSVSSNGSDSLGTGF
jgi:hypothetical protein